MLQLQHTILAKLISLVLKDLEITLSKRRLNFPSTEADDFFFAKIDLNEFLLCARLYSGSENLPLTFLPA